MTGAITGRALLLGDDVNTDVIQPSRFFSLDRQRAASGILAGRAGAGVDGGIIVAGRNFGVGSSRESVIRGLLAAGLRAVVARSVSRIFLRNAINNGLPVFAGLAEPGPIESGDLLLVDPAAGLLRCEARGLALPFEPLDAYLADVLAAGGLLAYLRGP